jgi:hypothetical protein
MIWRGEGLALKRETSRFSETLASANQFTLRFNPVEYHLQNCHRREILKSHILSDLIRLLSGTFLLPQMLVDSNWEGVVALYC